MAHSGDKYRRIVADLDDPDKQIAVDVYEVLSAFDVRCPARQHAIKKLLCAGLRQKGDEAQDLTEAKDAVQRAIELANWKRTCQGSVVAGPGKGESNGV